MTNLRTLASVMSVLVCSATLLAADIQSQQKSPQSPPPAAGATTTGTTKIQPPKQVEPERSVAKAENPVVRKGKRRPKQTIIVIVVDDQESSWI